MEVINEQYGSLADEYREKEPEYYEQSRPEMLAFVPNDARVILDVGCSTGSFGRLIKEKRPNSIVWGIEPTVEAAKQASRKLDRVINSAFDAKLSDLSGIKFDCIIFNDVLEHMVDPYSALQESRQLLAKNGSIVASIPNILHFYQVFSILKNQDWKYEDSGILDITHLRFFTKKSVVRMFENAGFHIEEISGICPSFGLTYRIANLLFINRLKDWKYVQYGVRATVDHP